MNNATRLIMWQQRCSYQHNQKKLTRSSEHVAVKVNSISGRRHTA